MNVDLSSDVLTKKNIFAAFRYKKMELSKKRSHLLQYLLLTADGLIRNVCCKLF